MRVDAYDLAQAERVGGKRREAQESTDKFRGTPVEHVEPDEAVSGMEELAFEVITIVREKSGTVGTVKQRNHVRILDAGAGEAPREPPEADAPLAQEFSLILPDVLIQQIHAAV